MNIKAILLSVMVSALSINNAFSQITLKAGHSASELEPYHIGLLAFSAAVEEKTGGEVKIEIYPNSQLGTEKEMIESVAFGTLDITVPTNGVLTNFVPELAVLDLPFLFKSREHLYETMDGDAGNKLTQYMKRKGFKSLAFYEAGVRHIMTTSKPIYSIDDLNGLKIRTMQIPAHISSFNQFGANASPLAYSELYGALESGVVDGAEAANTNYYAKNFYEVAPYWAQVSWTTLVADLIMSEKKFTSLSPEHQKAIVEAALESAIIERKAYSEMDKNLLDNIKQSGVTVTFPDPKPFRNASKNIYDKYVKTKAQKEVLSLILN